MTIDEIIGLFQRNLSLMSHYCPSQWREALEDAIPLLRKAKDEESWTSWPMCPKCATPMRRESISYILFTCPECDHVCTFDMKFKAKEEK